MRRHRSFFVAGLVGAVLATAAAWAVVQTHGPSSAARHGSAGGVSRVVPGRYVYVEAGQPGTRFLPLGTAPQDGHTLSAQRAYNLLVAGSAKLQLIPAGIQPYYGVLDYWAAPRRVWAFTTTGTCAISPGRPVPGEPTPSPQPVPRCRSWEFVNATTGHDLGILTQEVLPD